MVAAAGATHGFLGQVLNENSTSQLPRPFQIGALEGPPAGVVDVLPQERPFNSVHRSFRLDGRRSLQGTGAWPVCHRIP